MYRPCAGFGYRALFSIVCTRGCIRDGVPLSLLSDVQLTHCRRALLGAGGICRSESYCSALRRRAIPGSSAHRGELGVGSALGGQSLHEDRKVRLRREATAHQVARVVDAL
jgi:hypothetical protein